MKQKNPILFSRLLTLIPSEWKVLLSIAEDQSADEIADKLCLTKKSVETYQTRIGNKLELNGSRRVAYFARQNREVLLEMYLKFYCSIN